MILQIFVFAISLLVIESCAHLYYMNNAVNGNAGEHKIGLLYTYKVIKHINEAGLSVLTVKNKIKLTKMEDGFFGI